MTDNQESLSDLLEEATQSETAALEFEPEESENPGNGEDPSGAQFSPDMMAPVFAALFQSVANIMCARAGVDPVSDGEAAAVGKAGAQVAALYEIEVSPEVAAWLGLGMSVAAVALPRLDQYAATLEQEERKPDPVPGAA